MPHKSGDRNYSLLCENADCYTLCDTVWPQQRQQREPWTEMVIGECDICAQYRDGRCRVRCLESDTRHEEKPFTDAPYLHPFNHPRYHALLLRAVRFARAHGRVLIWYRCEDKPYKGVDDSLRGEQLERRRQTWLKYSDDKTAGIVGLLPLVRVVPLRCTDTIDRDRNLFKHTRCTLEG